VQSHGKSTSRWDTPLSNGTAEPVRKHDAHHRHQKLPPKAGVLSVDISGPFKEAPDLHKKKSKYLLVASFTWPARKQDGEEEEEEIPEVPDDAPGIDDPDAEEKIKLQNKKVSLRKIRKKIQRMTRKKKFKKEEK
jgi:hypothetical protein